jgi:hypothetical protein
MKRGEMEALVIELILNTHKKAKRSLNLVQIAEKIKILKKELGSLNAVAKKIDLSNEMVREFWSMNFLSDGVKKLIRNRKIDLVDIAYRLSLLKNKENQLILAMKISEEGFSSKEVREIVSILRMNPKISIEQAISKYNEIKNIIRYKFIFPSKRLAIYGKKIDNQSVSQDIKMKIERELGSNSVYECSIFGDFVMLILTENGFRSLRNKAKEKEATKKELIFQIVAS